jgi:hypothetical protein
VHLLSPNPHLSPLLFKLSQYYLKPRHAALEAYPLSRVWQIEPSSHHGETIKYLQQAAQ